MGRCHDEVAGVFCAARGLVKPDDAQWQQEQLAKDPEAQNAWEDKQEAAQVGITPVLARPTERQRLEKHDAEQRRNQRAQKVRRSDEEYPSLAQAHGKKRKC